CVENDSDSRSSDDAGGGSVTVAEPTGGAANEAARICAKQAESSLCDQLSGEPCPDGSTCDFSKLMGGFKCFDVEAPAAAGEFCDNETVICGPGLFCEDTTLMVCQHYCCDDSDCAVGVCYGADEFFPDGETNVGACFDEYGGLCAFAEEGEEPEECLEPSGSAGAGGSAP
ncbi:MAG: hypothetical protein M3020_22385, partial [Myxococcota bacterium]|nr:hypothetical protein [Myxococcota bacterium]